MVAQLDVDPRWSQRREIRQPLPVANAVRIAKPQVDQAMFSRQRRQFRTSEPLDAVEACRFGRRELLVVAPCYLFAAVGVVQERPQVEELLEARTVHQRMFAGRGAVLGEASADGGRCDHPRSMVSSDRPLVSGIIFQTSA